MLQILLLEEKLSSIELVELAFCGTSRWLRLQKRRCTSAGSLSVFGSQGS